MPLCLAVLVSLAPGSDRVYSARAGKFRAPEFGSVVLVMVFGNVCCAMLGRLWSLWLF